jgi:hypothetical protein
MPEVSNPSTIKKRITRFLTSTAFGRQEIAGVIDLLSPAGSVGIFGGALRDLALSGNQTFPNDVDLVVSTDDVDHLSRLLADFQPVRNRHGGYSFRSQHWKFDVWALPQTWAIREGLVTASSLSDLVKTTFFDWDAIVYDTSSKRLSTCDDYFEKISIGMVDINLVRNPNPIGNAVRALRIYLSMRAGLSRNLGDYVLSVIDDVGIGELVSAERKGFKNPRLNSSVLDDLVPRIRHAVDQAAPLSVSAAKQLALH